jgi:hypothetical protein
MKSSMLSLLVVGLLAALLASCRQPTPGEMAAALTAAPTAHPISTGPNGQLAWQGFLDHNSLVHLETDWLRKQRVCSHAGEGGA